VEAFEDLGEGGDGEEFAGVSPGGLQARRRRFSKAGEEGLKEFATRLNMKPEQYMYPVLNHYAFDPPAGFSGGHEVFAGERAAVDADGAEPGGGSRCFTISVEAGAGGYQVKRDGERQDERGGRVDV